VFTNYENVVFALCGVLVLNRICFMSLVQSPHRLTRWVYKVSKLSLIIFTKNKLLLTRNSINIETFFSLNRRKCNKESPFI
jgi:hypothetical protein